MDVKFETIYIHFFFIILNNNTEQNQPFVTFFTKVPKSGSLDVYKLIFSIIRLCKFEEVNEKKTYSLYCTMVIKKVFGCNSKNPVKIYLGTIIFNQKR